MMRELKCELCSNDLSKNIDDGIIILARDKKRKILEIIISCRGICHDRLEFEFNNSGYSCIFKEMNTGLKYFYNEEDFQAESLEKYLDIITIIDSIE